MSNLFCAINPATGQKISEYQYISNEKLNEVIERSYDAYLGQLNTDLKERICKVRKLADLLDERVDELAKIMTDETGKPFSDSKGEIHKCAKHSRFFADKAEEFLAPRIVKSEAKSTYVRLDPIGPIHQIVPFNFPFWLCFKPAIAIILQGNTIIHRNARICPDAGLAIEKLFVDAGFDNGEFINVFTEHGQTEVIIAHPKVRGVTFTGSTKAGSVIASCAGKNLKKCVMELGGSDPVIVLDDADLESAADIVISSRMRNGGQTCTAGKRFIIDDKIYDNFMEKLIPKVRDYKIGDPYEKETELGPLRSKSGLETLEEQIEQGLKQGGKMILEGGRPKDDEKLSKGFYFKPCIIEVDQNNILWKEETFGPVFAVMRASNETHALKLANDSKYGLGAVVVSGDSARAERLAARLEVGTVAINQSVNSDSRLPSGGVKASGFGRECGEWGMYEFANIKTVWVEK